MTIEVLTQGDSIETYYRKAQYQIINELRQKDEDYFINNEDQIIVQQLLNKYALLIIEEDSTKILTYDTVTVRQQRNRTDFDGVRQFELEYYDIELPLVSKISNLTALRLQGSRDWPIWTEIGGESNLFRERDHVLIIRAASNRAETRLEVVRKKINLLSNDIELYTPHFRSDVERLVQHRKAEISSRINQRTQELQKLGIKPKEKLDAPKPASANNALNKKATTVESTTASTRKKGQGDTIHAPGAQGFINNPAGPIYQIFQSGTQVDMRQVVNNLQLQGAITMGDTFNLSGDFREAIVNIKNTLANTTKNIGAITAGAPADKEELKKLVEQLSETLQQPPADKAEEAEDIANKTEELVKEASKKKIDKDEVEHKGNRLLKAAQNVAAAMPTVLPIAQQIVNHFGKMIP